MNDDEELTYQSMIEVVVAVILGGIVSAAGIILYLLIAPPTPLR